MTLATITLAFALPHACCSRERSQRQLRWPVVGVVERVIVARRDLRLGNVLPGFSAGDGGTFAVALAVHLDDGGMVYEAVDSGDRHRGVWKNVIPSGKRLIGGDGDRVTLVAMGDELEQGAGLDLVLSHVGQVIEHDEIVFVELVEHGWQAEIAPCGLELLDHIGGGAEQDPAPGIDEGMADG